MGTIVAAQDETTGDRVALKCLLPVHCGNPRAVARFRREARVTARLCSEHVVRVLATGEAPGETGFPPIPYFVMEHLDGRDLRSIVLRGGPLSLRHAARCVSHACHALAEAHALGIVHRDIKPANLYLTRGEGGRGLIKVLDFGVARVESTIASGDGLLLTAEAELVGSVSYMAPEQILDASSVDARADIWSLGVVLYCLLTGHKPFDGDNCMHVALDILEGTPPPLLEARPDLPEAFADVVHRCLEKDRGRRYASAADLAQALAPFTQAPPTFEGEDGRSPGARGDTLGGLCVHSAA
jgi:serine/threonine-protein kinase